MDLPQRPLVVRHEVTASTNERAFAALADGSACHGDVHVASLQTAGRGRLGRRWIAAEGEGLLASLILLSPPPPPPSVALTMATCLAVRDAVRALGVPAARLKWPNDVLVENAKLCGILVETRGFDPGAPHFVVGFGLNVAQTSFPEQVTAERPVTSLANEGVVVAVEDVLERALCALRSRLASIDETVALARDYRDALELEAYVRVSSNEGELTGELASLTVESGVELRSNGRSTTIPLELIHGIASAS